MLQTNSSPGHIMHSFQRRAALSKILFGLAGVTLAGITPAYAQRNPSLREELKYRERALGQRHCASCVHFRPGSADAAGHGANHCELIPNDDEINPGGVCDLWSNS